MASAECSLPPAGISSLQYHKMTNAKCVPPDQLHGTAFLSSSHFKIAQDPNVTQGSLKSVFKKDYIPWRIDDKPAGSLPPRPADILQTDTRYFNERASETKLAYEHRNAEKPQLRDVSEQLRATNFKMDRDPKFNSFQTTHNSDFTPKKGDTQRVRPGGMQSFIPQGDPEKAPQPVSDYRDRFRGHDVGSNKVDKATGVQPGAGTIQGDKRQHHFSTTHNDTFRGSMLPKVPAIPKAYGTNIPQGDPSQFHNMHTIQQMSYVPHSKDSLQPYDKSAVMGKLQHTNFTQKDGHNAWNTYLSTMTDSYRPVEGQERRSAPARHRNHSDFPAGDDDSWRNSERSNLTTNRFHYGNPPDTKKPTIVSGANKRTASNVCFGEPELAGAFYETTTDTTFQPVTVPYKYNRPDNNTRSQVPLDYYGNENNGTTYMGDFLNPKMGRMEINSCAIENLKESHIRPPLGGHRQFTTEHLDQYTPKPTLGKSSIDAGKLQRSSVPIGTLNQN